MPTLRLLLLLLPVTGLWQCASKDPETMAATEASKPRSMSERFNNRGKQGYYQDSEGNWKVQNDKRSSFEQVGRSSLDDQSLRREAFETQNVEKRSWSGKNQYEKPIYQPPSAQSLKTTANAAGQKAREQNSLADLPDPIKRENFSAKSRSSREQSRFRDAKNAATENSNEELTPDIMDWKEQRALQLKDTKSWLNK
jgi:hypothetical protein